MGDNPKGYANPGLLVTPGELSARIAGGQVDERRLVVLDLRPAEHYAAGHIPGAVHLDLFGFSLIDTDPAPLSAFCWMIEHVLASRGVADDRSVVVYDDRSGMRAARALWFLEYFGHRDSAMLDGGFGAWTAGGHTVTREPGTLAPTEWQGARIDDRVAGWREVKAALGAADVAILDTRSDGEYTGATVRAARGGAIPGAVHVEWTRNLDESGAFRPADELRALYGDAGLGPDREVVTYCQGGYRAAHSYIALRLIGYPRVRKYLGSWKEWGDRLDLPVETPHTGQRP